ncbi:hypothetical protein Pcinc_023146 [Petrolisthes cinctipes]|uniref:Uncharacterized protein n=1 Tax=Petrolisthes cinctipes TaxID=88211 RepID=A0AAE1KFP8_PETCI|nr:hypothetical protein Pcinc_023146 [Petrolisthes cinctipes]
MTLLSSLSLLLSPPLTPSSLTPLTPSSLTPSHSLLSSLSLLLSPPPTPCSHPSPSFSHPLPLPPLIPLPLLTLISPIPCSHSSHSLLPLLILHLTALLSLAFLTQHSRLLTLTPLPLIPAYIASTLSLYLSLPPHMSNLLCLPTCSLSLSHTPHTLPPTHSSYPSSHTLLPPFLSHTPHTLPLTHSS